VDEVNDAETPATWQGDVWDFTTQEYLVVEDFESYDSAENQIWYAWKDGLGYGTPDVPPYYAGNGTGAAVGHENTPSYTEETIVHGGKQSMPFSYNNTGGAASSEAELTLTPAQDWTDWTAHGIQTLSLWFYGDVASTPGQLYVKINGVQVDYDGDASNLTRATWRPWNIDLTSIGTDLTSITSLAIGVQDAGAVGVLLLDDIRLYPYPRELIMPAEPDAANLVGYWPLNGDYQDASGNGRHGVAVDDMGNLFIDGVSGQALDLSSGNGYVEIPGFKGVTAIDGVQQPFSISNWFKITETSGNNEMVTWGLQGDATRLTWSVNEGRLRTEHNSGNLRGNTYVNDGEWHHAALTVAEGANLRPDVTKLYVDGVEDSILSGTGSDNAYNLQPDADVCIGCRADNKTRFWPGSLDEVRIYDRVLSAEEVAGLAGNTKPVHKPF